MKKTGLLRLLVPAAVVALSVLTIGSTAFADSGRRAERSRESSPAATQLAARQGGRDTVIRSGSRGYTGSRGYAGRRGYSTRYLTPGHRHSHSNFSGSIWIGPGWGVWDPFWYPYPYPSYRYYAPPTVVVPQEPQEYILPESQPEETGYWYYCRDPQGYYPYVERCPGGWLKVLPDTVPPDEADKEN